MAQSLSSSTSIARIPTLSIAPSRSTTAHRLRHGSGAGKGPDTRAGWPGEYSGALRGADLHSCRVQGTQGHYWTEALATVSKGFSTEGDRFGTSEVRCAATGGRCHSVAEAHSTPSRKRYAARRVRTLQTFPSPLRTSVSAVNATLHCRGINLHERALQAVKSVPTPSEGEAETKEIIADVLRGFLLLENAALTGSEQVFVFGVAGKSFAYNHTANGLRETWGSDERLRSHDIALSQQLQGGHLAGGVHWTGEEKVWQEMDYDYEDPLDPRASEWYDTEGYDNESYPDETGWTEDFYETDDYDPNDSTFSDHFPALLEQPVETQEGDTSKLETVQEAVAAANAAADMSWTQARQLMKDVHRSRGYSLQSPKEIRWK